MMSETIIRDIRNKIVANEKRLNVFIVFSILATASIVISIVVAVFSGQSGQITIIPILLAIVLTFLSIHHYKKNMMMNVALWMMERWVDDNKLNEEFFKYFCIETDGDFIEAIMFLEKNYNMKIPQRR